jgi:hypothetical protein
LLGQRLRKKLLHGTWLDVRENRLLFDLIEIFREQIHDRMSYIPELLGIHQDPPRTGRALTGVACDTPSLCTELLDKRGI